MYKNQHAMVVALCAVFLMSGLGCAKKNVRHLASDISLVTPEKTSREQVLTYLGQPDKQYEMDAGPETWVYYEENKDLLSGTPYIGDTLGEKKYEMVKVTFDGNIVKTCVYRLLTEEEFLEGEAVK